MRASFRAMATRAGQPILDEAYAVDAIPVTTTKDAVRLDPDQRQQVNVLTEALRERRPRQA